VESTGDLRFFRQGNGRDTLRKRLRAYLRRSARVTVGIADARRHSMSEMTLMRAITERHAVRSYTDQIVDERTVRTLLDAAVRAPTAIHAEPWAFAIVQDKRLLAQLSERAKSLIAQSNDPHAKALASLLAQPGFNIFYDAGTLIVIGARPTNEFAVADCWLAAENLMLTACAMGLGSCVIGFAVAALQLPEVKADLGIPADVVPVAPIIIGVPREATPATSRRPPEIVAWKR
jgi:nitroreductase